MTILHIVRTSPFDKPDLAQCCRTISDKDAVILIDDGCYGLHHDLLLHAENNSIAFYAIDTHVKARALTPTDSVKLITMSDWVALTLTFDKTITWQ